VPYGRIIPDARPGWTPNNSSAFFKLEAKPWWSLMAPPAVSRVAHLGNWFGEHDIYGDGIDGGHGARNVEHRRQHTIGRVAE